MLASGFLFVNRKAIKIDQPLQLRRRRTPHIVGNKLTTFLHWVPSAAALSFNPGLQFTQTFPAGVCALVLLNLLIVHWLFAAHGVAAAPIVFLH